MLDILLLNVHRRYLNYIPQYGGFLGIYLLAAFARQEGYQAKSFSGTLLEGQKRVDALCATGGVAMVGLYCDYDNVSENVFLCHYIKEKYHLPVVVGGPQATALREDFCKKSGCDALVRYEGELTLLELMNYFLEDVGDLASIRGISFMDNGKLITNPERPLIENLDRLPFIDEDCYLEPRQFFHGLSIMTGRGCPFHCAFCHEGAHTRKVRFRSVANVLAEIDDYLAKNKSENLYILFTDDTLTLQPKRVKELCDGLVKRQKKRSFKWFCEGHVHTLYNHPEMIADLGRAGCTRIQLGIEAGTAPVLKAYGKNTTPEEILSVVRQCRDAGIKQIYGNIILAGANFSKEIYEQDKKFVQKLLKEGCGTAEIGVVSFWPLPETPMTTAPADYGVKICDKEFVTSVGDFPQAETAELDRYDIAMMQRELEERISRQMIDMLENWEVPTERVLSWFAKSAYREGYGGWYVKLLGQEVLYPYYEMLYLGEGQSSKDVDEIAKAHPLRVVPLYKHMQRCGDGRVEIRGEYFSKEEMDIVLLTTGKVSVEEICERTGSDNEIVMNVLTRLERRHFIVYAI